MKACQSKPMQVYEHSASRDKKGSRWRPPIPPLERVWTKSVFYFGFAGAVVQQLSWLVLQ